MEAFHLPAIVVPQVHLVNGRASADGPERRAAVRPCSINAQKCTTQAAVLDLLRREGGPRSVKECASALGKTKDAVQHALNRLVDEGWIVHTVRGRKHVYGAVR